jgi:hypothetical protein
MALPTPGTVLVLQVGDPTSPVIVLRGAAAGGADLILRFASGGSDVTLDPWPAAPVVSVFGRTGAIVASGADYASYSAALGSGVLTFNSRSGAVTPASGDYASFYAALAAALTAGGSIGQRLTKNSSTNYDASWKSPNYVNLGAQNPPSTTSTTGVMMGLGVNFKITPAGSGIVQFNMSGYASHSVSGSQFQLTAYWGTGTPPANGAGITGTVLPSVIAGNVPAGGASVPFAMIGLVTGAAVGTPLWIDVALKAVTAGTVAAASVVCNGFEL